MNIAIIALGSRGDVQPFVALGLGLERAGHRVTILATVDYQPLVAAYGLAFHPVAGSVDALMDRALVYDALDGAHNPLRLARRMYDAVAPLVPRIMRDCLAGCTGANLLIASTLGLLVADGLAEALGVPLLGVHFHPYSPTSAMPSVSFPSLPRWLPWRGAYNRLSQNVASHGFWQLLRVPLNEARRTVLGLAPLGLLALVQRVEQHTAQALYGYSETVLPRPRDWAAEQIITGYWFLPPPPGWNLPPALEQFLAGGPPPVYLSFGSTLLGRDATAMTALLARAIQRTGRRALLHTAWGDLDPTVLPPEAMIVGAVPHDWLFARVAAVVHHGGAGTTAATLRAEVPSVVVPVYGDQFLWARRAHALGAAPPPLPRSQLTEQRLAAAIDSAVSNVAYRQAAARIGAVLRNEDGVGRAVAAIHTLYDRFGPP